VGMAGLACSASREVSLHLQLISSSFPNPLPMSPKHSPRLVIRSDGRYEIRCPQCEYLGRTGQPWPLGIGMPITDRAEAESIARNHAGRAA
jgi:hypothetical protein